MILPYQSSGQQLGETRQAMTKTLMTKDIQSIIDKCSKRREKYYILVHGKPYPDNSGRIKIKLIVLPGKPSMMLSCMLFGVDNQSGKLTLEWALPGDWPTWSVEGSNEPVPEVIASINKAGAVYFHANAPI